jgi:hypothetical protein
MKKSVFLLINKNLNDSLIVKSWYRKISLIFLFLLIVVRAPAPIFQVAIIPESDPFNPYERLINAIVQVESSGDTLAFNPVEKAVGALQIRPIRILDYNQRTGKKYKIEDCYNFYISKEIFLYYAEGTRYFDYELIARNWNGSGKTTLDYWKRVKTRL